MTKTNKLIVAAFAFLAVLVFGGGRAHAATLVVDGNCTLDEAIISVNAASSEPGCSPSGSYGTSDSINIPAGTQTLTANLTDITTDVVVVGAGMSQTVIDGDGSYKGFGISGGNDVTVSNLKIANYRQYAIFSGIDGQVSINHVEVDGSDAAPSSGDLTGIFIMNLSTDPLILNISNAYIHDLEDQTSILGAMLINQGDGGTMTATLQNITIANISNSQPSGGGTIGVMLSVGLWASGFGGFGTLNTTASNITIDNVHSATTLAAPFSSNSYSNNGDAFVNTTINNVTVTNTDGVADATSGANSAAFYAAAIGVGAGTTATSTISAGNSLLANNKSGGVSNNCETGDFTSLAGGLGTGVTSVSSIGHNLFDDVSCASDFNDPSDQHGVSSLFNTLGILQNNGGAVPTRALLAGSPAISAGGSVLGVTTDARGVARPSSNPSVGAYQYVAGASTTNSAANAGAPNTGISPASTLGTIAASLAGIMVLGYLVLPRRS